MSPEKIPTRTRLALAQKLRFLRFTRGWSQEVLAELAGLHRTYISQIERGQVDVSVDNFAVELSRIWQTQLRLSWPAYLLSSLLLYMAGSKGIGGKCKIIIVFHRSRCE